jgi:hypothetical protein
MCAFSRFLVVLVLYLGIGIAYKYRQGAQGKDRIPNYEFWANMPGLMKVTSLSYLIYKPVNHKVDPLRMIQMTRSASG